MNHSHGVILLTAWGSPDLPEYIAALQAEGVPIAAAICAGEFSARDTAIILERTAGHFTPRPLLSLPIAKIPFHFVTSHNAEDCVRLLRSLDADILLNAGTPNILKTATLRSARRGVLNSHPGLLPQYRGRTCVEWAIYNDSPVGATCHFMTESVDEGPVVLSRAMAVERSVPYEKVRADMIRHCCAVLAAGAHKLLHENLSSSDFPASGAGKYWDLIPSEKMTEVRRKLSAGEYESRA